MECGVQGGAVTRAGARRALRWLLGPVWRRLWFRVEQRLESIQSHLSAVEVQTNKVPSLENRLSALESGWAQHVPTLLNATSSVAAFGYELVSLRQELASFRKSTEGGSRNSNELPNAASEPSKQFESIRNVTEGGDRNFNELWEVASDATSPRENLWKFADGRNKNIEDLWNRLEFIRKEIMYELKYGGAASVHSQPRVVSPDKLATAERNGIRLNLGCGHVPLEGYVNVDQRELPGVDIIADVGNLPIERASVREIFSAHVLEHFPQERLRSLLCYWHSLLTNDGVFRAIVPDGQAMIAGLADATYPFEQFREVLFGAHEYEGDFHLNLLTPDSLTVLLSAAGFKKIEVPVKGRRNERGIEFEISAMRGTSQNSVASSDQ